MTSHERPVDIAAGPGPAGVVLRAATSGDGDAIRALDGLAGSTRRLMARDLAGELPRIAVVAHAPGVMGSRVGGAVVDDRRVVGFAIATDQPDEVHLLDLAVAVDVRRRGIGRRLVGGIATRAVARGAGAMTLEVRVSNEAARVLYDRLGFTSSGVRPGYYRDGEDAVIMWHRDLDRLAATAGLDRAATTSTTGAP